MGRLVSPSGFLLVGLLLLLPFVGVSCSDTNLGALDGGFTGVDLATGGDPAFEASGPIADNTVAQATYPDPGVQPLAVVLIVVLLAGLGTALIRVVRVRSLAAAAIALLAAILAVLTQLVAQANLVTSMRDLLIAQSTVGEDLSAVAGEDYLSAATGSRVGFWLILLALAAVVVVNALALREVDPAPAPERQP